MIEQVSRSLYSRMTNLDDAVRDIRHSNFMKHYSRNRSGIVQVCQSFFVLIALFSIPLVIDVYGTIQWSLNSVAGLRYGCNSTVFAVLAVVGLAVFGLSECLIRFLKDSQWDEADRAIQEIEGVKKKLQGIRSELDSNQDKLQKLLSDGKPIPISTKLDDEVLYCKELARRYTSPEIAGSYANGRRIVFCISAFLVGLAFAKLGFHWMLTAASTEDHLLRCNLSYLWLMWVENLQYEGIALNVFFPIVYSLLFSLCSYFAIRDEGNFNIGMLFLCLLIHTIFSLVLQLVCFIPFWVYVLGIGLVILIAIIRRIFNN